MRGSGPLPAHKQPQAVSTQVTAALLPVCLAILAVNIVVYAEAALCLCGGIVLPPLRPCSAFAALHCRKARKEQLAAVLLDPRQN